MEKSPIGGDHLSGKGWISEDSDFYGSEAEQSQLREDCEARDLSDYVTYASRLPANIAYAATPKPRSDLYNPFEGQPEVARQLSESIDDFVKRLPPSGIGGVGERDAIDGGFWIWIANPQAKKRTEKANHAAFVERGQQALDGFEEVKSEIEASNSGKTKATIMKKLKPHREELEKTLKDLALRYKVTTGKWMLFPSIRDVDKVWRTIAQAVVDGKLGRSAKVATDGFGTSVKKENDDTSGEDKGRLICIYNDDFSDLQDVRRVLNGLVECDLIKPDDSRGIYYKADMYTYLEISSGNKWGLKASLYSSREMLKQ